MIPSEKHRFVHLLDTELDSLDLRHLSPTFSPFLLQPHGTSFDFTACFALFRINHRNLINGIRGSFFSSSSMISISLWCCLTLSLSLFVAPASDVLVLCLSLSLSSPRQTEYDRGSYSFLKVFKAIPSCTARVLHDLLDRVLSFLVLLPFYDSVYKYLFSRESAIYRIWLDVQ